MVLGHRRQSVGSRSSIEDHNYYSTEDETVVDPDQGNVLMHIISQLRPGADLSRVTLPTFILEPRSMLERITNFMAHPEILLGIPHIEDPVKRFVSVVKFYLSGWHIRPPGVKKPLNPVLGEIFTGFWEYPDQTKGYYISEQTSHHPPKSSYFFMVPDHHIRIDGTLKPRSKFLGNSAASMMEGIAVMRFTNHNERYFVTQPNIYSRGILFGKMKYELGDHSYVKCPELGLAVDIEFKTKGYFSGTYNAIGGFIKDTKTDRNLYELSGMWTGEMFIKDLATGQKELLFNARGAKHTPPSTRPLAEQEDKESQKLWEKTIKALVDKDHNTATSEKTRIEDEQRAEASRRADEGIDWRPRLFRHVQGGPGGSEEGEEDLDWIINAKVDGKTPEEQTKQILQIAAILPGQQPERRFSIPTRKSSASLPTASMQNLDISKSRDTTSSTTTTTTAASVTTVPSIEPTKSATSAIPPTHPPAHPPAGSGNTSLPILPNGNSIPASPPAGSAPLPSKNATLRRQDSRTHDVDEFHDAES